MVLELKKWGENNGVLWNLEKGLLLLLCLDGNFLLLRVLGWQKVGNWNLFGVETLRMAMDERRRWRRSYRERVDESIAELNEAFGLTMECEKLIKFFSFFFFWGGFCLVFFFPQKTITSRKWIFCL